MHGRPVDERDTEWERDLLDFRVVVTDDKGAVSAFDFDSATCVEAQLWAKSKVDGTPGRFSLAIRRVEGGRLGLDWLFHDVSGVGALGAQTPLVG